MEKIEKTLSITLIGMTMALMLVVGMAIYKSIKEEQRKTEEHKFKMEQLWKTK